MQLLLKDVDADLARAVREHIGSDTVTSMLILANASKAPTWAIQAMTHLLSGDVDLRDEPDDDTEVDLLLPPLRGLLLPPRSALPCKQRAKTRHAPSNTRRLARHCRFISYFDNLMLIF